MRELPLNRRIDHLLDVLYDAADVPHIHRKYVGYLFEDEIESLVDHAVSEQVDNLPGTKADVQDLESRIEKLEDTLDSMARLLTDR